jgi:SAM-dependent methyltransferase
MDETWPTAKTVKPGDPTRRFSDRVENYVKYRPGYPPQVLAWLGATAGLTPHSILADVGSGTGISSRLFLDHGCTVFGIEPNREMRQAGERLLAGHSRFRSVDATAEATTLPDRSVDLVTAGQAFHWFEPGRARTEFSRILKPGGKVALLWNRRKTRGEPFLEAYEQLLLEFSADYQQIRHENIDAAALAAFFGPQGYAEATFANRQSFDFPGLRGRLLSSSYAPAPGAPRHNDMMLALLDLFERFNAGGRVSFEYDTQAFAGTVGTPIEGRVGR